MIPALPSMPHINGVLSDIGQVDVTYWFEGLRVKRACYDTLARYLTGIGA